MGIAPHSICNIDIHIAKLVNLCPYVFSLMIELDFRWTAHRLVVSLKIGKNVKFNKLIFVERF